MFCQQCFWIFLRVKSCKSQIFMLICGTHVILKLIPWILKKRSTASGHGPGGGKKNSRGRTPDPPAGRQRARPAHGRARRNLIEKKTKPKHLRLLRRKRKEPAIVCRGRSVRAGEMHNSAGERARLRSETVLWKVSSMKQKKRSETISQKNLAPTQSF